MRQMIVVREEAVHDHRERQILTRPSDPKHTAF